VLLRSFEPRRRRVLDRRAAYLMLTILRDVVDKGTGRYGLRGKGFTAPAGGKTGTTNESTDSWFVGFTPKTLTLVWLGFDRKQKIMHNGTGGLLAAPTWTAFMEKVVERDSVVGEFPSADALGLKRVTVARSSGLLAAPFCNSAAYTELFIPGTEPERYCSPMAYVEDFDYGPFAGAPPDPLAADSADSLAGDSAGAARPEPPLPRVDETYDF
jgi:membrane carboxypeptidase/penicillin-binding protein